MPTLMELSATLRKHAKHQQLTQDALRKAAGLSKQTLTNVLRGDTDFKVTTLLAVADQLDLDVVLIPKAATRAFANELAPGKPLIKTRVQAALDQVHERIQNMSKDR